MCVCVGVNVGIVVFKKCTDLFRSLSCLYLAEVSDSSRSVLNGCQFTPVMQSGPRTTHVTRALISYMLQLPIIEM